MRISCIRLVAALGFLSALSMAGAPARAQLPPIGNPGIPGLPGTPVCPPNSSCAPGTPAPPATCGPSNAGVTCSRPAPAAMGSSTGVNVGAGNPINVINGNKYQREVDMAPLPGTLGLEIVRHYNSSLSRPGASTNLFGRGWKLSYETSLYIVGRTLQVVQADGSRIIFNRDPRDPSLCASADPANGTVSIVKTARGDEYVWRWANGRQLSFDTKGKLLQILAPGGQFVSLRYDPAGLLTRVTDPQGRSLELHYPSREQARSGDAFRGVQSIDSPVGRFTYHHGSPMPAGAAIDRRLLLASLVKVDMPSGSRTYHYEQADQPTLLTGISELMDGKGGQPTWQRIATYGYDINGKANLSVRGWPARLARGADGKPLQPARLVDGTGIGQVTLEYGAGETVVSNSQGRKTFYRHAILAGEYRLLQVRGAGCSGCGETNVRYDYDDLARLQATTRLSDAGVPLSAERQEYDRRGRLGAVSDIGYAHGKALPARLKLRYEYEGDSGYPVRIVRPSVVPGRLYVTSFKYAQGAALAGLPLEVSEEGYMPTLEGTGSAGTITRTMRYRYDHYGQRVETDGPLPNAASRPGPANSDISLTRYDERTKLPLRTEAPGGGSTEVLERDAALRPTVTRFTDTDGVQIVRVRYNWRGQPEELRVDGSATDGVPPLSQKVQYTYAPNGKLIGITQPGGLVSRFGYDAAGRMTRKLLPDGSTVNAAYDTEGRHTSAVLLDANGRRTSTANYRFDESGHMAGMDDGLGTVARASFTPAGAVGEISNPLGIATRFDYDDNGMLVSRTSAPGTPDAASIGFAYDAHGRQVRLTDANGVTTLRRFDDFGRPMLEVSPDRGVTLYFHDAAGRLLVRSDGAGNETRFRHDLRGRLVAVGTTATPELTRYRYLGRRLTDIVAAPDGKPEHASERTSYRYDALGQVLEEKRWYARVDIQNDTAGLSFVTTNTYDEAGRLSTQVLPDGHELEFQYAAQGGALIGISFDHEPVVDNISYTPTGVASFQAGNGIRHAVERDARGQIVALHAVGASAQASGWLARLRAWFGAGEQPGTRVVYAQSNEYDQAGRLVAIRRELGQAGHLPRRHIAEQYAYDRLDRLTGIRSSDGPSIFYAYDKGGNRTQETHSPGLTRVSAAAASATGTRSYLYEPGSNRLVGLSRARLDNAAGDSTENARAGMGSLFDSAWLYRPSGAPFSRIGFAAPQPAIAAAQPSPSSQRIVRTRMDRQAAVYDARDRLVAAYAYNAHGERFAKTVFVPAQMQNGPVRASFSAETKRSTTYSLYRDRRLAAEADGNGSITAHYIYLDGKPVARIDMKPNRNLLSRLWLSLHSLADSPGSAPPALGSSATLYAIHTDHLGTPQSVTNAQREIVWQARTSPFGQATVLHASVPADEAQKFDLKLRLPGQVHDVETGLNQNYFRDYDPELGRYTTPDPMGLAGDVNPYVYAGANPLTNVDPLGLYQSDIHYYMTMFLGIAAGMRPEDAQIVALASQYVDENDDTRPLNVNLAYGDHVVRLLAYHFTMVPSVVTSDGTLSGWNYGTPTSSTAYANIKENPQLQRLYNAALLAKNERGLLDRGCTQLQLMGEYLHSFEDTFAHRDPDNHPFALNIGLGHGYYDSDPDYTFIHKSKNVAHLGTVYNWKHNEARTLQMEFEVYKKLTALGNPGKAIPFAEFSAVLANFNSIREHEGRGGNYEETRPQDSEKIRLLQRTLDIWVKQGRIASGVNWTGTGRQTYVYSVERGAANRNEYLCDIEGNALDQKKYAGTILPRCNPPLIDPPGTPGPGTD